MISAKMQQFAKQLAQDDKKSLSQKLAKTMEEVGELASVILPHEDADGVRHRFIVNEQILEECVDVVLCAQSIIHSLNFSKDEVEAMVKRKLEKWHGLQATENEVFNKPIPYEIHITVSIIDNMIPTFCAVCQNIDVKPIVLELQRTNNNYIQDVMTSSVHYGYNHTAYHTMTTIADTLRQHGFEVVRQKIETVPWHPAAPKTNDDPMPTGCYFESHLAVLCCNDSLVQLSQLSQQHNAHLSRNQFKTIDEESFIMMVTLREYSGGRVQFEQNVRQLKQIMEQHGFSVDKVITEFSIYDSKVSHDAEWMTE